MTGAAGGLRHTRLMLLAGVAGLLAGTAACGGGADEDEVSRAQFIERADAVCRELRDEVNALPFSSPDADVLAGAFRDAARLGAQQVDELRDLEVPAGDGEEIDAVLDLADRLNQVGRQAAEAKAAGDDVRFRALLQDSRDLQQRQRELALRYGFRACAGRP